jgi:predicted dehydrogenase
VKISLAIVGTSQIAREFARAALPEGFSVTHVVSRDAERGAAFAAQIGCPHARIFPTAEALTAAPDIPKAAYVASPNTLHVAQSEVFLRAGIHVICEKPAALTVPELNRLHKLAQEKKRVFTEAIMYLHTPERTAVRQALREIAPITGVSFDFSQFSSKFHTIGTDALANVFSRNYGGGARNDLGIYCAYPLADFFGEPEKKHAAYAAQGEGDLADLEGGAVFSYPGFFARLHWSKRAQGRCAAQCMGIHGTLAMESVSQFQGIVLYDNHGGSRLLSTPKSKEEVMRYEARAFADYIRDPSANAYSGISLAQAQSLSCAAHQILAQTRQIP